MYINHTEVAGLAGSRNQGTPAAMREGGSTFRPGSRGRGSRMAFQSRSREEDVTMHLGRKALTKEKKPSKSGRLRVMSDDCAGHKGGSGRAATGHVTNE